MAHAHGAEYDEDRGGPRHPHNYQSYPKDGVVYKATKKVWPWEPPGNHEQEDRMVIPGVFIETLFALAPVPEPEALSPVKFMVKCLSLEAYQAGALSRLIEEGLFVEEDERATWVSACTTTQTTSTARRMSLSVRCPMSRRWK